MYARALSFLDAFQGWAGLGLDAGHKPPPPRLLTRNGRLPIEVPANDSKPQQCSPARARARSIPYHAGTQRQLIGITRWRNILIFSRVVIVVVVVVVFP